jgi:hypothetical protein
VFLRYLSFAPLPVFPRRDWPLGGQPPVADPDLQSRVLRRRLECKAELTRRFLAGELSFPQTAAHFRSVDKRDPRVPPRHSGLPQARTEEESYCLQVIAWTAAELSGQANRAALVAELEADLQEQVRQHGRPLLPEVDTDTLLPRPER